MAEPIPIGALVRYKLTKKLYRVQWHHKHAVCKSVADGELQSFEFAELKGPGDVEVDAETPIGTLVCEGGNDDLYVLHRIHTHAVCRALEGDDEGGFDDFAFENLEEPKWPSDGQD